MLASAEARTAVAASGPVLFARYAYGPNRLGYCGPDAVAELFGQGTAGRDDRALRELARGFDGAWPYLQLIAEANGRSDPLDRDIVEAYWLGNELLDRVTPDQFAASLATRFRPRLRPNGWHWLGDKPARGAVPVHAFHVLDVFPRTGLLRSGAVDRAVDVIDACRIRWGRVLERDGDFLVTHVVPIEMRGGQFVLGAPRPERIRAWNDGAGFVNGAGPGDVVSIHWQFACDRLSARQLAGLIESTRRQLEIANETV